jgi:signal transduction histidine kinase
MRAPSIDLKLQLALQVAALAAFCFAATIAYVLLETDRSARARADGIAELVAKSLVLPQEQARWITGARDVSIGLQGIAAAMMEPGLCMAYRAPSGEIQQQLCSGSAPNETDAPRFFADFYESLFDAGIQSARPVIFRGTMQGEAVASINPQSLIGQSWRETSRLAATMAGALLGLCVLVYVAFANALRPTRAIRAGLERLTAGDLSARLPPFDLAELSAVGNVFNQLAGNLETTLAERNALTRQLIAVQDEERRRLARELHDEFGQCLAAISAVAASAGQTAEQVCPALVHECQSIARTAGRMMEALRGTLLRLRPPDVDELGLAASLASLVAGWNNGGGTHFSIELSGDVDALPSDFAASLYRVAQEAITNAAKHAHASRVILHLCMQEPAGVDPRAQVELVVVDDGKAGPGLAIKPGMGLLGMRERVAALGGRLSFATARPSGSILRAHIPVPSTPARRRETSNAA